MRNRVFAISSIVCVLLAFSVPHTLYAQGMPGCWSVPFDNRSVVNVDSVAIDTCGLNTTLSCTALVQDQEMNYRIWHERRYYAKKYWRVWFTQDVIHLPPLPRDSMVYVSWQAIDTNYPTLRAGLQAIEQQYGSFRLRKVFPTADTGEFSYRFQVDFPHYVNAIDVMEAFNGVPLVQCYFSNEFPVNSDIPSDRALIPGTRIEDIQFAAPQTEFPAYLHKLGFQWNIYAMDLPLAWEITTGRPSIVLGAHDDWGSPCDLPNFDYSHPDLKVRENVSQSGNFLRVTQPYRGNTPATIIPNTALPLLGHGLRTLPCAIALGRNDNHGAPDTEQGRMIGTAFNCSGIGFYGSGKRCPLDTTSFEVHDYINIDTDFENNGTMQRVAVMNFSQAKNDYQGVNALIQAGTIVVAAAGNSPSRKPVVPSGFVYIPDINDPTKDYHVITVGGTQDGLLFQTDCMLDSNNYQDGGEFWKGEEIFRHNYSQDLTKFSTRTDTSTVTDPTTHQPLPWRQIEKSNSFSDLVAPCADILTFHGRTDVEHPEYNQRQYAIGSRPGRDSGSVTPGATSESAPEVAGICGLMVSVNRFLGVSYNQADGKPSLQDGPEVQRRAQKILTFTADKMEDDVAISSTIQQPQYVEQTNDPLRRSWAQRVGFGKANAYRAVAHAIANKGTTSSFKSSNAWQFSSWFQFTGNGNTNENGKALLHFGSRVRIGSGTFDIPISRVPGGQNGQEVSVLQYGGVSLPGSVVAHNNQGVTKLLGSSVQLSVPRDCILAIDGVVTTDSPNAQNTIKTENTTLQTGQDYGKILIAGYLDNVNVQGRIKAGDLIVHSTATNGTGLTFQNHGSTSDPLVKVGSEVYGVVTLRTNGRVIVDNNATLTLQPGGVIDMQGTQNIVVKSGATLVMEYPSTIKGNGSVVVENGGKIIVKKKPSDDKIWRTELLASVSVQNGGQLIVEEDALLQLGDVATPVYVEGGGTMDCKAGSHIIIPNGRTIVCMGKFLAVGEDGHRVQITSTLTDCGEPVETAAASISTTSLSGDVTKSNLAMKYCTVDNVSVWAFDMPTQPIEHCTFRTSRENTIRTMLYKSYTVKPPYLSAPAAVSDLSMLDCDFIDQKGDIEQIQQDQWRGNDKYPVSGVVLDGLRNVTVEHSHFSYLMHGIGTRLCDNVVVTQNTFFTSDFGLHDDGSAVLFCNNTCEKTERGNTLALSRASRTVDNTYTNVWSSVRGESAAQQYVRNNVIKDFREGVFNDNSPFVLQPQAAPAYPPIYCPSNNPLIENGYNDFISNDPNRLGSEFIEVETRQGTTVIKRWQNQQRDISFRQNALIGVYKGYNKLSVQSGYHLYKEAAPVQSVTVGYNEWNGPSGMAVRYNQYVSPTGTPLNTQDNINRTCDVLYGCAPILSPIVCPGDMYVNDGNWTTLASTDPYLDTVYTHARQDMVNSSYDVMCRRVKAHDALEAATLGQQKTTKLQQLITDYTAMAASGINPDGVRSLAMMLKGEVHERLGETGQAATAYTTVTTSYPTSSDAEVAAWRLHYLSASTTGTVGSVAYENAIQVYRDRVLEDMRASSVGSGPHKRGDGEKAYAGITSGTELKSLVPNPSDGEVTITYSVGERSMVRLVVVDALGRELGVVNAGMREAGEYSVKWDGRNLSSGMYAVRLECGAQVYSLPLVIVR